MSGDYARAVANVAEGASVVYRGWMLDTETYAGVAGQLERRNSPFQVTADAYSRAHTFPGWYETFAEYTPLSVWTDDLSDEGLLALITRLPPGEAIVKDHVKSMKEYWDEACFVPDTTDTIHTLRVIRRFLELRDTEFQGGIVLREYEELGPEVRTWWREGEYQLSTPHPNSPEATVDFAADFVATLHSAVQALDHPWLVVDITQRADGVWRVMEVGDAQVSGLPDHFALDLFYRTYLNPRPSGEARNG
jgi:hypothetical protein